MRVKKSWDSVNQAKKDQLNALFFTSQKLLQQWLGVGYSIREDIILIIIKIFLFLTLEWKMKFHWNILRSLKSYIWFGSKYFYCITNRTHVSLLWKTKQRMEKKIIILKGALCSFGQDILIGRERPLKDNAVSCCFPLFICGGPCHLSSFRQCSGDVIFLWEQLVY